MDKNKVVLISAIVLALALCFSSYVIAEALKEIGATISFGMQSAGGNISSGLNSNVVNDDNIIFTLQEAAVYLKIENVDMLRLAKNMGLPYISVDGKYIFSKKAIDKFLETNTIMLD